MTTELTTVEVRLVLLVITGTDVFSCATGVVVESGRATELLMKIELVEIELFMKIELLGIEVLVKTELVGTELLVTTGTDVLKCAEVVMELLVMELLVMELLVIGTMTVVRVEFRIGAGVTIAEDAVLLVTIEVIDTEGLLGRALLEMFMANDDELTIGLDVVSGAAVGVQEASDAERVTVLSYREVTSLEKV